MPNVIYMGFLFGKTKQRVTKNIRNVNDCRVGKLIKDIFYTCNRNKKGERLQICKIRTKFMSLDRLNAHRIV